MIQKTINVFVLAIAMLISTGCQNISPVKDNEECLRPTFRLAIPKSIPLELNPDDDKIIPPGKDWKAISSIPLGYSPSGGYGNLIYTKGKIWLRVWVSDSLDVSNSYAAIVSYDINTKTWKIYDGITNYKKTGPDELFTDRKGSVYGIDYSGTNSILISQYNETSDEFEPFFTFNNSITSYHLAQDNSNPMEDNVGNIWFNLVVEEGQSGLYKLNLNTKDLIFAQPNDFVSVDYFAISPFNKIWAIASTTDSITSKLYEIDPDSGEVTKVGHYATEYIDYLYFDHESNLWVSDKYWLELAQNGEIGTEYEIIRSPVFITSHFVPDDKYMWLRPNEMFQSSDGTYWFTTTSVGTVKLDKKTEEWCLITTGTSQVVEDSDQNVWIVIDNILYKKKL